MKKVKFIKDSEHLNLHRGLWSNLAMTGALGKKKEFSFRKASNPGSNPGSPIYSESERDIARSIILTLLITDGCVNRKKLKKETHIEFYNKDEDLHALFKKAMQVVFNRKPTIYFGPATRVYKTTFVIMNHSPILKELYLLSPTFNMKPKENKNPTIKFLLKQPEEVRTLCFRIAMSTEGCISINKLGKRRLRFGCSNPNPVLEWKKLANDIGINMRLARDRSVWSKIQGLNTDKFSEIKKFRDIGGFFKGCKAYRSKYHKGWEKNKILIKALKQ